MGMTLVEILVSLGIVAGLSALAMPVYDRLKRSQENTTCVSNLRQIGVAICTYANDNNGFLPGPLLSGQYADPDLKIAPYARYSQLSFLLKDYLLPDGGSLGLKRNVFVCPAFQRKIKTTDTTVIYGVNIQVRMREKSGIHQPFGYANALDPKPFATSSNSQPLRVADLANIVDEKGNPAAHSTFALWDADPQDGRFAGLLPPSSNKNPLFPVHGNRRNALFFDFHVAAIPITTKNP